MGQGLVQLRHVSTRYAIAAAALSLGVALSFSLSLFSGAAFAQTAEVYPARPIRLVNSLSAGSAGDRVARQFADALSPRVNQKVLVDNRPGDGGNIAALAVAKAPADGYLLLFSSTACWRFR